jgi:hypothetical protein
MSSIPEDGVIPASPAPKALPISLLPALPISLLTTLPISLLTALSISLPTALSICRLSKESFRIEKN